MLIDAQITAQNRNPRWPPSAILDFPKFDFCPKGRLLRPLIFHMTSQQFTTTIQQFKVVVVLLWCRCGTVVVRIELGENVTRGPPYLRTLAG